MVTLEKIEESYHKYENDMIICYEKLLLYTGAIDFTTGEASGKNVTEQNINDEELSLTLLDMNYYAGKLESILILMKDCFGIDLEKTFNYIKVIQKQSKIMITAIMGHLKTSVKKE